MMTGMAAQEALSGMVSINPPPGGGGRAASWMEDLRVLSSLLFPRKHRALSGAEVALDRCLRRPRVRSGPHLHAATGRPGQPGPGSMPARSCTGTHRRRPARAPHRDMHGCRHRMMRSTIWTISSMPSRRLRSPSGTYCMRSSLRKSRPSTRTLEVIGEAARCIPRCGHRSHCFHPRMCAHHPKRG